jgi:DNA-binding NarL/FixJ family response regulator
MMEAGGSGRRQDVRQHDFVNSAGEQATTVLLVDAHVWTREAIARGLEMALQDLRVLRFANVSELPRDGPHIGAAVVLLNVDGIRLSDARVSSAIAAIHSSLPGLPVVVLSEHEDTEAILEAIERGLKGYVPMSLELQVVARVLQFVAAGGTYLPAELLLTSIQAPGTHAVTAHDVTGAPTPAVTVSRLTLREVGVLELVGQGKSNQQIARALNTHEAMVEGHVDHVMRKLGAVNRTQVALLAADLMS